MKIEEHLDGNRVLHPAFVGDETPFDVYERLVEPTLTAIAGPVELCEIYSLQRKSEQITLGGEKYIVLDHGLTDALVTLDALAAVEGAPDFVAMGYQRLIAEACRRAGLWSHYAYFVFRALEVRAYLAEIRAVGHKSGGAFWRDAAIVGHEAAHALPQTHQLTETLGFKAQLIVSEAVTAAVRGLGEDLLHELGETVSPIAQEAARDWSAFKGDIGISADEIRSAFLQFCDDTRFLGEVACDQFALTLISMFVQTQRPTLADAAYLELGTAAVKATQRTFLDMRLLSYIDDVGQLVATGVPEGKINPLKMQALCEFSLRGNITTRTLMDAWRDVVAGVPQAPGEDQMLQLLSGAQDQHTTRLFEPLNALFEMTLLNEDFEASLDDTLTASAVDPAALRSGDISAVMAIDGLWLSLVDQETVRP